MSILKDLEGLCPPGTRPYRWAREIVATDLLAQDRDRALARVTERLAELLDNQPFITYVHDLTDDDTAEGGDLEWALWSLQSGYTAVYAVALRAVPGATEQIVYRAAPDVPNGWVPEGWEGRWVDRASMNGEPLVVVPPVDGWGYGVGRPTGRVEFNEGGQVAEVYEVTKDVMV
ncbi:hypothetical protein [Streptosporangium sp. NPDC002524]|uniref:hypothetical protein n=1 Tax=Streptosporangium sp. NPDC002524 TaxID=3154537 RepID=UPI0033184EC0